MALTARGYARTCGFLAEAGLLVILALPVFYAARLPFWHSLVLFAFLGLFVLDAWRPPVRWLLVAWLGVFAAGAAGFTLRFAGEFPLTASVDLIRDRFLESLTAPLPMIWATALVVTVLYLPYRSYARALGRGGAGLEGLLLVFVALVVYQQSLGWRWSIDTAQATFSIPWATALLCLALALRCGGALAGAPAETGRLTRAHALALLLLALHLLVLGGLLAVPLVREVQRMLALAGSLLGLLLLAALVDLQIAAAPERRRFKWVLSALLAVALATSWARVQMLEEIAPAGYVSLG